MNGARIHERGFVHYEGVRGGSETAARSLVWHSARRLLGLKRRARAKALPVIAGLIAYVPAIVFVGVAVLIPREVGDLLLPGSEEYLRIILVSIYLFATLGAPAILCPDRREGTLALYLASPLTRDSYLAAKAAALLGFLAIATVGPALLLLIGLSAIDAGPDGVVGFGIELIRAIGAGTVVAALVTGLTMALASLTDRHATASGFIALWLLAGGALVHGLLVESLGAPAPMALLDVTTVSLEFTARIYGASSDYDVALPLVVLAAVTWIGGTAAFVRWRYHRLQVTR